MLFAAVAAAALLAPATAAAPPGRLFDYITDDSDVLSASDRAAVASAAETLYDERRIRLWVVYVDRFSGRSGSDWAHATAERSDLGNHDALLAVATDERGYALLVSPAVKTVSQRQVDELRHDRVEPALHRGDWAGAAVAAAAGLGGFGGRGLAWAPMLTVLAVVALAAAVLALVMRARRRRRRKATLAAARRVDATDPDALATVPLDRLDDLSRAKVVDVDNALRTSVNELTLAIEEFGQWRTEAFTRAVDAAKTALAWAFTVRQRLDDALPETPTQQRKLLISVIVAAASADRELAAQTKAFEALRDLVINAPSRLDELTRRQVELTARLPGSQDHLTELHHEFDAAALSSVAGNVKTARDRISFAESNITRARGLADRAITGGQGELVDAIRGAESALGQARALLDAVDTAAGDIRHAVAELPAIVADVEAGVDRATAQLHHGDYIAASHTAELAAARDAAIDAAAAARDTRDPLTAFARLTAADADLDRLLATVAQQQATAERLARTADQALFTARSRIRAVSDYIDTRRGSIGPEARTRLAEAHRHLEAAESGRSADVDAAIGAANAAAAAATSAQSLAKADAQAAQAAHYGDPGGYRGGDPTGALLGGLIIGDLLGGGARGGFGGFSGGWSPTSFGGSSGGGFSGGDFLGGGGRF